MFRFARAAAPSFAFVISLLLAGCSGTSGSGLGGGTSTPLISVTVSGPASTRLLGTAQFSATVTNSSNQSVTWQVNGVTGGSSTTGTISASGLYTAPAVMPSNTSVTVSAIAQASSSAVGTASEALQNPLPVETSVVSTQIGSSQNYFVDVMGSGFVPSSAVLVGGSAVTTTYISATELQAPSVAVAAGATSIGVTVSNPSPGASTSTSFNSKLISVSVSVTGPSATRLLSTGQFSATVTGIASQAVNWQVNNVTGGNSTTGTISATGLYTAPGVMPAGNIVISATSQTVSVATGSLTEALQNPIPVETSVVGTQVGSSLNYLVDIIGTGFVPTSVIQVGGTAATTTYVSPTEVQATVAVASGTTSINVTVANPNPGASVSGAVSTKLTYIVTSLTAAARLLDQATFGPTANDIQHVQAVGINGYITEQFNTAPTLLASIPTSPLPAVCINNNSAYPCAESEWWTAAITGQDQLRQRVAFALSEMFVVSTQMVPGQSIPAFHNNLSTDAFANFGTIMKDVTLSPAMGAYLNMLNSAKPASGQIANENYARELMQLFTTGLFKLNADGSAQLDGSGNMIPEYTEAQVEAFARAYTGWTYGNAAGGAPAKFPNTANYDVPMALYAAQHDTAAKILLNGTTLPAGQTGAQDLDGALTNIFNDPNVGPFVGKQLIQHLVTSTPSPAYVARISAVFADNGNGVRGDMKAVIRAILTDSEARAGDTNASFDGGHLREPILFLTAMMRGLGFTNTDVNGSYFTLSGQSSKLNEEPYRANSVFNFFPPEYVIPPSALNAPEFGIENTATAVLRLSLADSITNNKISGFSVDLSNTSALGMTAASPANLVDTLSMLFMHSAMPSTMRTTIINEITPITSNAQRTRVAIYLIITSSQYKVIH